MSTQLSLFDVAPDEAPATLDPVAQRWLRSAGYTAEACVLLDPARIASDLAVVEGLLAAGELVDFDAFDALTGYYANARYGAACGAPHLLPRYDALRPRFDRAIELVLAQN